VAELAERLRLDLTDALAGDLEALTDLLESVLGAVADAEAHLDDALLAGRERLQEGLRLLLEVDDVLGRGHRGAVLDEVLQMRVFLLPDRRLERDRLLRDLEDLPDLRDRNVHPLRDVRSSRRVRCRRPSPRTSGDAVRITLVRSRKLHRPRGQLDLELKSREFRPAQA
jgi:hypothetical protein